jgi:hypothetical protein
VQVIEKQQEMGEYESVLVAESLAYLACLIKVP